MFAVDQLILVAKTARITQWVKNVVLFAPIVFSGFLFVPGDLGRVVWAFGIFCVLSSGVYILNDIVDLEKDRVHPYKSKRTIASGAMPLPTAIFLGVMLSTVAMVLSYGTIRDCSRIYYPSICGKFCY
jgi:4-hydroxybenzoate polyprenyltransferase